jgi:AAA domain/Bifunctional DNA primase/polymerase, N-terminal
MPTPADHPLLTAARDWFDAGFAVIPSHPDGGKRPFGMWKPYQAQRPTWADIEGWLSTGAYTGIGVICGSVSGNAELIEIEGPTEVAAVAIGKVMAVAKDLGLDDLVNRVLSGCIARSAGDGLHVFIRVIDGPAKGNTKLAMGSDGKVIAETRGEGGFVIVAPTPGRRGHREGAVYAFIASSNPARTVEVTAEERDALHGVFTIALDESPEPTPEPPQRNLHTYEGTSALDAYRATRWADILTPAGWTWSHRDAERDYWVRPGKSKAEGISASTIEDGPLVNFSTSVPWPTDVGLSKGQVYALLHHGGDVSAASRELSLRGYGDISTVTPIPAWEANLEPDATDEDAEEAKAAWVRENLPLLDWHALWEDETEEEWLVEPLLAKRRLVALYSAPKVGKSLLMLEIAASIASGRGVLGNPQRDPVRVLYVDFENDPRGDIRRRLDDMDYGPSDLGNLCYLTFPTMAALDSEPGSQQLAAAVDIYGCEVVVIDTVSRAIKGEENENDTWLSFYRHTGLKMKQRGVAMIRLDHAGKDETKGQRGGSAKSGDVDAVWRMSKKSEDVYELICEAKRFPIAEGTLTIKRYDSPLQHKVDGNAIKDLREEVMEWMGRAGIPRDGSMSIKAIASAYRADGHTLSSGVINRHLYETYCKRVGSWSAAGMETA